MQVIAHGVDIVEVARIERMLADHADRFAERCFTVEERAYCDAPGGEHRRAEKYAVRFACKEAVMKALSTGWTRGIGWTEIEVRRAPSGQPLIRLWGQAEKIAAEMDITSWLVSLSHTETMAIASVIGVG